MSMDDHGTKCRNVAENFNRLSRVHERYRQTTDGRAIAYSEREHEFTFAKKELDEGPDPLMGRAILGKGAPFVKYSDFLPCAKRLN